MMKKSILFLFLLGCFAFAASAQSKDFQMTARDSAMCKAWKVTEIDRFSVKTPPTGKEVNDGLTLVNDLTGFVTLYGETLVGTWNTDKSKSTIFFTVDETKKQMRFRIVKYESEELVLKFQDEELMTTVYTMVPKR